MGYYIDLSNITLEEFKNYLETSYLLPSQQILKEDINKNFKILKSHDIENMQHLQQILKNKNKIISFNKQTSLPIDYLTVLRRTVNSFHPKARKIKDFATINDKTRNNLENRGIKTTPQLYDRLATKKDRNILKQELGADDGEMLILAKLCDVSRLRYVNPTFATLLVNSDYDNMNKIRNADFNELYKELVSINKNKKYFKGKINLKDIKFLVNDTEFHSLDVEY